MLALFGVPVAQEEHAWRAVRAALELQQRLREVLPGRAVLPGEALTARVGVHTGWVVVGSHSEEPQQSVVVGGDTTQGAMRLQGLADPGTLVVSDATLRLLRATVHSAAYGLVWMPGHAAPLMAYTVQGLEAPTAPRRWSPFVGRQRELAVFDDLLARVLAGQGQVVGLIGEPGIGKSRLLAACRQRLPDRPVTVLEGHCRSYDHLIPYGPISDLLRQQCGLSATAASRRRRHQVAQLLRPVGLSAGGQRAVSPPAPGEPRHGGAPGPAAAGSHQRAHLCRRCGKYTCGAVSSSRCSWWWKICTGLIPPPKPTWPSWWSSLPGPACCSGCTHRPPPPRGQTPAAHGGGDRH